MKTKYPHLFSPLTVKNMTMRNRTVMMPMGTNYANADGSISDHHINYYTERAKGGVGLIIVENVCVKFPQGSNGTTQLRMDHDSFIPGFYRLTESVHAHGGCIAVQINHAGASAMSSRTGEEIVSSSDQPSKAGGQIPRPLTKDEILEIVKKYGEAARRAQIAGFDAVEIHAGHSYLISQFLSPIYNKRTDEFGGSAENRARFCRMIIDEVRNVCGPMFPIILRLSAEELMEGGNTLEDTLVYLETLDEGTDIYDVSAGLNGSIQKQIDANYYPDGWRSYMSKAVKEKFNKPCINMGNYRNPQVAEDVIAKGEADLIGLGRGLIADPEWANKAAQGRECDIRKCISCNIGCAGHRIGQNRPIRCTVNPSVLDGDVYKNLKIKKACNVVVIGGGTAGLEAACTAAEVGCTVFLLEKENVLGGLAAEISKIPAKNRLADFPNYLIHRASQLSNLFIFTGFEANEENIRKFHPDIIVSATGSKPLLPPIKGLHDVIDKEGSKVYSITGMINNIPNFPEELNGKKVAVIGGGAVGLDVVEFFAPKGADVSIVEMMPAIGRDLDPVSKNDTTCMMAEHNVKQLTNTALLEVKADAFVVKGAEGEYEIPFDYGFVCLGMRGQGQVYAALTEAFAGEDVTIINIGDSKRARRIIDGTFEGRNIIDTLTNKGYF